MKKRYLSALLFGALFLASTTTFTSCKDYDDDIAGLQSQVDGLNGLKKTVDELSANLTSAKEACDKQIADLQAQIDALKEQGGGSESGISQEELTKQLAELEKKMQAEIDKKESIANVDQKINALREELKQGVATTEQLKALEDKVNALTSEVEALVGHRLTSIALIPTAHINGIPAIEFKTLKYTPQVYSKDAYKDHNNTGDHQGIGMPVLDHVNVANAEARFISTESNEAHFHVNPSLGVRTQDIEVPSFDCIESTNTTRSAEGIITNNSPIVPVSKEIKDGVLTVKYKKSADFLNKQIVTEGDAHGEGNKEAFYMASLKVPVTEANWTAEEKEDVAAGKIDGVYVNSEYARIEESIAIPYLVNSKTDFSKPMNGGFADETQDLGEGAFYVHYHDSLCLYKSDAKQYVDVIQPYNQKLDLNELVKVCATSEEDHGSHYDLTNYKEYGLEFRFALASAPYLQGENKTDEQAFAKIIDGHLLKSEVYDVELGDDEYSRASIGREPIVRVSLVDTKNNNALVAQRYVKVQWAEVGSEQVLPPFTFDNNTVTCHDMFEQLFTQDMNEAIYHNVEFNGQQSISKDDFHKLYKSIKVISLKKDGQPVDLTKLDVSTAETDWNKGTDAVEVDGGEAILNNKDLVFTFLPDAKDNTSYNLVWAMTPEAVGKLAKLGDKEYASKFEIEVEYVDAVGTNGNIRQTFVQTIVAPTQEFAYQGTYWKNGKGEGTFNVNPIVYNTSADGKPAGDHDYGNICELKDYSHIDADLVNGYVYKPTNKKPANLAQFIQQIRNCAEVKFVFDQSRFGNYAHLAGYNVSADGTALWKGAASNLTDYEYVQNNNVAASINNKFGADATENKKNLPWDLNETLGSGVNEASAVIRLHEKDVHNGTSAALNLVGKAVPVNLVVAYNDYNVIPVQQFEVFFIDPLAINGAISGDFTDAEVDGSFINVAKGLTFTDWNGYTVSAKDVAGATAEKDKYAHALYDYYAVRNVRFLTDQVTTSLAWDEATGTYIHKDGVKDGVLPTGKSLKQMLATDENDPKHTSTEVDENPNFLAYFNNEGTPVNVNYEMFVDVEVAYKWGVLKKADNKIKVNKAEGTPSGK